MGQRVFLPEARHGCGLFPDAAAHPWAAPRTLPLARHSERTQGTSVMAGRAAETLGVAFRRRSPPRTCLSSVERGRRDSPPSHGRGGAPPRDRGVHGPRARGSRAGAAARGAPEILSCNCPPVVLSLDPVAPTLGRLVPSPRPLPVPTWPQPVDSWTETGEADGGTGSHSFGRARSERSGHRVGGGVRAQGQRSEAGGPAGRATGGAEVRPSAAPPSALCEGHKPIKGHFRG